MTRAHKNGGGRQWQCHWHWPWKREERKGVVLVVVTARLFPAFQNWNRCKLTFSTPCQDRRTIESHLDPNADCTVLRRDTGGAARMLSSRRPVSFGPTNSIGGVCSDLPWSHPPFSFLIILNGRETCFDLKDHYNANTDCTSYCPLYETLRARNLIGALGEVSARKGRRQDRPCRGGLGISATGHVPRLGLWSVVSGFPRVLRRR